MQGQSAAQVAGSWDSCVSLSSSSREIPHKQGQQQGEGAIRTISMAKVVVMRHRHHKQQHDQHAHHHAHHHLHPRPHPHHQYYHHHRHCHRIIIAVLITQARLSIYITYNPKLEAQGLQPKTSKTKPPPPKLGS